MTAVTLISSILTICLFVVFAVTKVYQKLKHRRCTSKKLLHGKTALVTGGTAGMGLEVATELARRGAKIIIASPFPLEGQAAIQRITEKAGSSKVDFLPLDLGSFADIRRAANDIIANYDSLDILVNNAGVGGPSTLTKDEFNYIIQVNYLGSVLLTLLLLPLLRKSGQTEPSRIVNVASVLHNIGTSDTDKWKKSYIATKAYSDSKMCLVMFSMELSRRLSKSNVVVNSLEPGTVGTGIYSTWDNNFGSLLTFLVWLCCKTSWEGAQTTLHAAIDEEAGKVTGQYFIECSVALAGRSAYHATDSAQLWEETMKAVQFSADEVKMALTD